MKLRKSDLKWESYREISHRILGPRCLLTIFVNVMPRQKRYHGTIITPWFGRFQQQSACPVPESMNIWNVCSKSDVCRKVIAGPISAGLEIMPNLTETFFVKPGEPAENNDQEYPGSNSQKTFLPGFSHEWILQLSCNSASSPNETSSSEPGLSSRSIQGIFGTQIIKLSLALRKAVQINTLIL